MANLLCEHSLINAFVDQVRPVPHRAVEEAAHEFELDEVDPMARPIAKKDDDRVKVENLLQSLNHLLQEMGRANAVSDVRERKT